MEDIPKNSKPALVFGASGEQGRAVLEGFVDAGYYPVYGFTSNRETVQDQYLSDALQCIILEGQLGNPEDVRKAFMGTKAQTIFLTTTTEMPVVEGVGFYKSAHDEEYDCIVNFFSTLKQVYQEDGLSRTVVFSTQENVDDLCRKHFQETGQVLIEPLDDGSIVPHFSGKSFDPSLLFLFAPLISRLIPCCSQGEGGRKGIGTLEGYTRAPRDSHHDCFFLQ